MIEFRNRLARELGLDLIVHINEEGVRRGVNPFTYGSKRHTDFAARKRRRTRKPGQPCTTGCAAPAITILQSTL